MCHHRHTSYTFRTTLGTGAPPMRGLGTGSGTPPPPAPGPRVTVTAGRCDVV
jgi:hypothetical protein